MSIIPGKLNLTLYVIYYIKVYKRTYSTLVGIIVSTRTIILTLFMKKVT